VVHETNTERISEQLVAMGLPPGVEISHEAIRLPNGYVATLVASEMLADQGAGIVDVVGDHVVVLDNNWQVAWAWNPFDKLDLKRQATLNDPCTFNCVLKLAATANDWTHSNSLQYTADGNLLLSIRDVDWVVKIDYRDGNGTGDVLWRLGPNGDFTPNSTDPSPWFSHQHDARLAADGTFTVFDNGNTRVMQQGGGNSRGQVWRLDENARTATLVDNIDMGVYSLALGTAQPLSSGNMSYLAGYLKNNDALLLETPPTGAPGYQVTIHNPVYRVFRMRDIYTP
jgi:arylsulfate sulfotransferase